jgi:hypothetical protein
VRLASVPPVALRWPDAQAPKRATVVARGVYRYVSVYGHQLGTSSSRRRTVSARRWRGAGADRNAPLGLRAHVGRTPRRWVGYQGNFEVDRVCRCATAKAPCNSCLPAGRLARRRESPSRTPLQPAQRPPASNVQRADFALDLLQSAIAIDFQHAASAPNRDGPYRVGARVPRRAIAPRCPDTGRQDQPSRIRGWSIHDRRDPSNDVSWERGQGLDRRAYDRVPGIAVPVPTTMFRDGSRPRRRRDLGRRDLRELPALRDERKGVSRKSSKFEGRSSKFEVRS